MKRLTAWAVTVAVVLMSGTPLVRDVSAALAPISFGKSLLAGESSTRPTSLQFGPDGRLYVLQQDGTLKIYTVVRQGANNYRADATETVLSIKNIPNHDDNGALNNTLGVRQATGMIVRGTASNPVLYISSSDPRYGGGPRGDLNLDTNSGMVSRLTWNGTAWVKLDLVRGLPRSEENHAVNGLAMSGNTLYLAVGGNNNMGAPSHVFADLPETAYSAAVVSIDLAAIGNSTYDLPTLNDPAQPGVNDATDPFGGNDGANQAKIVPGSPVQIFAPGFRNPYDLLISSKGLIYVDDNGHNAGQGDVPINEGPQGNCTNATHEPGVTGPDSLHIISQGYYGGHPNPTRGNVANTFHGESPIQVANPIECDYFLPGSAGHPVLATDPSSSNGIAEYTASNFGGAMKGDLLLGAYDNYITRIDLDSTGTANATPPTHLFNAVGVHPLDVIAQGDNGPFPGTIWVADVGNQNIYVFEPGDYGGGGTTCVGTDSAALDEDADGFDNADEIDNGTDPCSAGDAPHDWDGDKNSDLNDADDDNDGMPDTSDPFAIDAQNGLGKSLPQTFTFDGSTQWGGLLDLGFTGLTTNGVDDYNALFDAQRLTAGGAPGVLTVDQLSPGNTENNHLEYGFQFGVKPGTGPFTAHTLVVSPFGGSTPTAGQAIGLQIGTGNQDNYVKIELIATGGGTGVTVSSEVGGVVTTSPVTPLAMPGPEGVDLYLDVNVATASVQPAIRVTTGGTTGVRQNIGSPFAVPASWLNGQNGVAVGLVGSSPAAATLSGSWDMIEAIGAGGTSASQPDETIKLAADAAAIGNDIYNTTGSGQTRSVTSGRGTTKTFNIKIGNDAATADTFLLKGPGSSTGFTVKYLKGPSGTTNITAAVVAGTYRTASISPAGSVAIRVVVTIGANAPAATTKNWMVTATSNRSAAAKDAVVARVATP